MSFCVRAVLVCGIGMLMMVTAQSAGAQGKSASTFDRTLERLRQSVAGLVKENQGINDQNTEARARIKALQQELRSLQTEAMHLEGKRNAQVQRTQNRSGGVEALKAQVEKADGALKQVRDEAAAEEARLKELEDEETGLKKKADGLSADIAAMAASGSSSKEAEQSLLALKAEKNALEKQLFAVMKRTGDAKRQWQDAHAMATTGPQQMDTLKAEHEMLVKAVSQTESDLTVINARLLEAKAALEKLNAEDYSEMHAGRLESEIKDMAVRNNKLESQIVMITKTREEKIKRFEEEQERSRQEYQAKEEELLKRNADLKAELASLRQQMVDLDKKKSSLESELYSAH